MLGKIDFRSVIISSGEWKIKAHCAHQPALLRRKKERGSELISWLDGQSGWWICMQIHLISIKSDWLWLSFSLLFILLFAQSKEHTGCLGPAVIASLSLGAGDYHTRTSIHASFALCSVCTRVERERERHSLPHGTRAHYCTSRCCEDKIRPAFRQSAEFLISPSDDADLWWLCIAERTCFWFLSFRRCLELIREVVMQKSLGEGCKKTSLEITAFKKAVSSRNTRRRRFMAHCWWQKKHFFFGG